LGGLADYGMVGGLLKVAPTLTAAIKEAGD
jgi:electron transfer flavoprotein alpha subunit